MLPGGDRAHARRLEHRGVSVVTVVLPFVPVTATSAAAGVRPSGRSAARSISDRTGTPAAPRPGGARVALGHAGAGHHEVGVVDQCASTVGPRPARSTSFHAQRRRVLDRACSTPRRRRPVFDHGHGVAAAATA